jgi:hypothetical protein
MPNVKVEVKDEVKTEVKSETSPPVDNPPLYILPPYDHPVDNPIYQCPFW